MPKKNATLLIGALLLAAVLGACVGGIQPVATEPPIEPTILPRPDSTSIPSADPSGSKAYPPALSPYPPADQAVTAPAYSLPVQPYPAPWQPQTGDQSLQRGEAFVTGMDIRVMESFPPQFMLDLKGTLPTPCHQLRVEVALPDSQMKIQVSVYSVVDPNVICIQVLAPFDAAIPLQGQPTGEYTVMVNGKTAGSIDVP